MAMPAAVVLIVSLAVASPSPLPRLILSLQKGAPGRITVRIENVSDHPLALGARTYLALVRAESDEPAYWAEVTTSRLPTPSTPMRLAGRQRMDVPLDLRSVMWSPDRSGMGGGHPLARGVPPGRYELQVRMVDDRGAWWRSGDLAIKVSPGGGLTF